ncbi:MAG: biotin transporter BioY [Eubacteriales bacterium]|nr:biotin transporter BioY [Eubacteriales bacterium]
MKISVRDMTLISLFTVLSIVGAKISLPVLAIPFTFQFIISLLTGIVLGGHRALLAQGLYLFMGLIGLPVFAKGGGIAYIFEPSFGYLIGMALGAGLVGFIADKLDPQRAGLKRWQLLPVNFLALAIVYSLGVTYLFVIKNFYTGSSLTLVKAFQFGMIPFLLNDSIYCVIAAMIGPRLRNVRSTWPR